MFAGNFLPQRVQESSLRKKIGKNRAIMIHHVEKFAHVAAQSRSWRVRRRFGMFWFHCSTCAPLDTGPSTDCRDKLAQTAGCFATNNLQYKHTFIIDPRKHLTEHGFIQHGFLPFWHTFLRRIQFYAAGLDMPFFKKQWLGTRVLRHR